MRNYGSWYNEFVMRSIKAIFFVATALLAVIPWCAQADTQIFMRPLRIGDSGPDVFALQQLLNRVLSKPIAATGDGSPGQETVYFGSKTRVAVIRLQEQFAADILTPVGLRYGTGTVGLQTLLTLNRLWAQMQGISQNSAHTTPVAGAVYLNSISPQYGSFNTVVTLKGSGFTNDNTIFTSYAELKHVASIDGTTLTFAIPASIPGINFTRDQVGGVDATLPFFIYVTNVNGQSEALQFTFSPF